MGIDEIECDFNEWLKKCRDQVLCRDLELVRLDRDNEVKTKQDKIDETHC